MALRRFCVQLASSAFLAVADTWNLVDIASAVCPRPTNLACPSGSCSAVPPLGKYVLQINKTAEISDAEPYIFSFLRKSRANVSITFEVKDSAGLVVIPSMTANLQDLDNPPMAGCQCTGDALPSTVTNNPLFGAGYGLTCSNHDQANCPAAWGAKNVGPWCCAKWCYSSANCPDALPSELIPGKYYSYSVCDTSSSSAVHRRRNPSAPVCPHQTYDPCACKDMSSSFTASMVARFSNLSMGVYGSACKAWDLETCGDNYDPTEVDTWCCKSWCYVDKECPSAIKSLNVDTLYYSENVCPDDATTISQCPYKPVEVIQGNECQCLGNSGSAYTSPPADLLSALSITDSAMSRITANGTTASKAADWGKWCGAWDKKVCSSVYPSADKGMWCCLSWCWVSKSCPTARESTVWRGHYFTYSCPMDPEAVSSCQYAPNACACVGDNTAGNLNPTSVVQVLEANQNNLPASVLSRKTTYGATCNDHDSTGCMAAWGTNKYSDWSVTNHSWCCESWCYVSKDCPIGEESWLTRGYTHRRRSVFWSYETCDNKNDYQYDKDFGGSTDACVAPTTSSTDSSPVHRRRAPAPATPTHRRRTARLLRGGDDEVKGTDINGRQLAARRRTAAGTPAVTPLPGPRRRAPTPRRRTPDSARRRAPSAPSVPAPRRRASPPSPRRRTSATNPDPTPRRRAAATPRRRAAAAAASERRRAPVSAPPATDATRRRALGINGQAYSSDRRRAPQGSTTPAPPPATVHRRRTIYGYADKPKVLANFGGTMPRTVSYGYSGAAAIPPNRIATLPAVSTLAAGSAVAVGVGSLYAYNRIYNTVAQTKFGGGPTHRRRVAQAVSWCYLRDGTNVGNFMDCTTCQAMYATSSCQPADGGTYVTGTSYNRDDLAETGFLPGDYAWPLSVTFSAIQGPGIDKTMSGMICPPITDAQFTEIGANNLSAALTFSPELFMLLTRQSKLGEQEPTPSPTSNPSPTSSPSTSPTSSPSTSPTSSPSTSPTSSPSTSPTSSPSTSNTPSAGSTAHRRRTIADTNGTADVAFQTRPLLLSLFSTLMAVAVQIRQSTFD
eukprot:TRINITY_DN1821_c0_g1_i1.p1 TRINITY_DN1821_c0_g1~~TRINITY_DN1821_c0_g1_i1.p1  ORF type:complete len:1068 (+),score=92.33 TRINITY_DN1821_c0_g1_i1:57-3260(+)